MNREKILIVEDDEDIRELTALYFRKEYQVFTASNGHEALDIVDSKKPNLILLDVVLPGLEGYEICEKIRLVSNAPVLFLSSKRAPADKVRGLEVGGDDFITKPFDLKELDARVKANLRRWSIEETEAQTKRIFTHEHLSIDLESYDVFVDGKAVSLYTKELQLLLMLAENPNHVFSAEQLYDSIWGIDSIGDLKTVLVHISNLRRKIEKDPAKPRIIKTVRGFGYKLNTK
ncbi:MAG: response regulator transcription factor [Bacillus sp. (in: Bacteria)]|nr:response regulator transcription factor [Bacillus sp. (in: firmicutes)]